MSDEAPAAVLATYANYRRAPSRKVLQLIFEVPVEQEAEIFEKIGYPGPHGDSWFAIARTVPPQQAREPPPRPAAEVRDAGILCKDPEFWAFLRTRDGYWTIDSEATAADYVRSWCGVHSRRDIRPDRESGRWWRELMVDFMTWRAWQSARDVG
jgi:hypothetical protein